MIANVLNKIFTDVLWPKWLGFVSKSDSPKIWRNVFEKTAKSTNAFPVDLAVDLANTPSVVRLMLNTFKPDRDVPSAKDFAVSIKFELNQQDYNFNTEKDIDLWRIRSFASSIRREWLDTINQSPILKARLKDVRDKHPSVFLSTSAECTPEFEEILSDPILLKKAYFSTYNTPDATEKITVWLPGEHGAVKYSPEERITTVVALNAATGADLGFFRMGHDYSIYDTSVKVEWLRAAYGDNKKALEALDFGSRSVGVKTNHCLWVK